jgi:uncharacterized heparinase superfamily protein
MILRQLAFAAKIPPEKLAARIRLLGKRKVLAASAWMIPPIGLRYDTEPVADALPSGLLAAKGHMLEVLGPDSVAMRFLGERQEFNFPIDWHREELKNGTRLWLLNLHYMEYLAEADDVLFERLVLDWIAGNPSYCAGYWTYNWNSYSLSIRVVAIMKEVARRRERLRPDAVATILRSLSNQIRFLARNLETDIGGNHIVKNIKALAWGSTFFAGRRAEQWRQLALRLLDRELEAQILADGVHFERSPSYHAQVFGDLLETRHVLGPGVLDGFLDEALAQMAQPLADLAHPDGGPAVFNDAGLTMAYPAAECLEAWQDELGGSTSPRSVFAYPEGGYYGMRTGDFCLIADMGLIGPDELPAHAHGDVGSFELSVAGERLIVDQGVFEYSAGDRRALSRSAASHNVLHIEGGDQAEFYGAFRCGRRPSVRATFEEDAQGFVLSGQHDGYANLPGRPLVERTIRAAHGRIAFEDRVEGSLATSASIRLLLHPEVTIEEQDGALLLRRGGAGFALVSDLKPIIESAVYWPDMGVEVPTRRIRLDLAPPRYKACWELRLWKGGATS